MHNMKKVKLHLVNLVNLVKCFYLFINQKFYIYFFRVTNYKMEAILSDMNFDAGMAIPIANLENKKLEHQV